MTAQHWQNVHTKKGEDVSWWQDPIDLWLDLLDDLPLSESAPIVDVGAGSSHFVDALVARGFSAVTALDVAAAALDRVKHRMGDRVEYIVADVLDHVSSPPVQLWHDRAVFHFLVSEPDQQRYAGNLRASLAPGGHAIVATFAPDGPESCSGLPVRRWEAAELASALGLVLVRAEHRIHVTPWGARQPFTAAVLRP